MTPNYKEFVEVELNDTLTKNRRYYVEFYVSLADNEQYALWNIGAYFSVNGIYGLNLPQILSFIPQVTNISGNYITNKIGWTKISGTFVASGVEKYITIGDFEGSDILDTLFVDSSPSVLDDWRGSYYYIDDVSVYEDTSSGINDKSYSKLDINIFPNPATDKLNIKAPCFDNKHGYIYTIEILNMQGQIIKTINCDGLEITVDLTGLSKGIYIFKAQTKNGVVVKKFVKE